MIVVVGSRYDPVAAALAGTWPQAELCSAEDLTSPGWAWPLPPDGTTASWVINGVPHPDDSVTGVFVRRSAVYPEELLGTHPDDRSYLAAEAHAFLLFVLNSTTSVVVNPVADGALGDEVVRPEKWMVHAAEVDLRLAPLRLTNRRRRPRQLRTTPVQIVGEEAFGEVPTRTKDGAVALARTLGLRWVTFLFDDRRRLLAATTASQPGPQATAALGRLLAAGQT